MHQLQSPQETIFRFNGKIIKHGDPTQICGIVNVTPDSFSDGGKWYGVEKAVERAKTLIQEGCTMIDIGGESTRPGSHYVEIDEEINRVVPVIQRLKAETDVILSVDTWKAPVAKAAIEAGVDIVNDITGLLGDPDMAQVVADSQVGVIVMNNPVMMRPDHPSATIFPLFGDKDLFSAEERAAYATMDVVDLMAIFFDKSIQKAQAAGIALDHLMLDPGIGFGLTQKENYQLIQALPLIHQWGYTCFLGVSRKRFIQTTLDQAGYSTDMKDPAAFALRDQASAALTAIAAYMGIEAVRVHVCSDHHVASLIGNSIRLADQQADVNLAAYKNKSE